MFRDWGGEQCRGVCSEVLLEEIKEAAPRRVRDGGVVRVERLLGLLKKQWHSDCDDSGPRVHNFYVFPIVARLRDVKKRVCDAEARLL